MANGYQLTAKCKYVQFALYLIKNDISKSKKVPWSAFPY